MTDTPAAAGTPDWVARYETSARPDHQECARDYHILETQLSACRAELAASQEQAFRLAASLVECGQLARKSTLELMESERLLAAAANDAERYHRVMGLIGDTQMAHGKCQPRSDKACTACNAQDALSKLLAAYGGPPIQAAVTDKDSPK